jgi:hypothetical protein
VFQEVITTTRKREQDTQGEEGEERALVLVMILRTIGKGNCYLRVFGGIVLSIVVFVLLPCLLSVNDMVARTELDASYIYT